MKSASCLLQKNRQNPGGHFTRRDLQLRFGISLPRRSAQRLFRECVPKLLGEFLERLKPEAAYFFPEDGKRTALYVFDVQDEAQIPVVVEPFFRVRRTEDATPLANRFVGRSDTALGEQIFHISKAEREAMIQPDGVANDVGRKSVAVIAQCGTAHRSTVPPAAST